MDEFFENQAADETVEDIGDGGQEDVVDLQETDEVEETEEGGDEEREEGGQPADAERERAKQSHEDNAAARAARIRAEKETEERLRREYDAKLSKMGIQNPYTNRPFSGFADMEDYAKRYQQDLDQAEAKKQGRTPEEIAEERENRAYIAKMRRAEEVQKAEAAQREEHERFLRADLSKFVEQYPTVDIGKLEQNEKFRKFAGKRLYKEPLSELYGDFVDLVGSTERAAVEKAARKQERATGGGGTGESVHLTPKQERDLDDWNRANPQMKMTAKEFLSM